MRSTGNRLFAIVYLLMLTRGAASMGYCCHTKPTVALVEVVESPLIPDIDNCSKCAVRSQSFEVYDELREQKIH